MAAESIIFLYSFQDQRHTQAGSPLSDFGCYLHEWQPCQWRWVAGPAAGGWLQPHFHAHFPSIVSPCPPLQLSSGRHYARWDCVLGMTGVSSLACLYHPLTTEDGPRDCISHWCSRGGWGGTQSKNVTWVDEELVLNSLLIFISDLCAGKSFHFLDAMS